MKTALAIIMILFISGCTTIKPAVTKYKLVSTDNSKIFSADVDGCKDKIIKISQAFSLSSLMHSDMKYTEFQNRVFSYSQAQWQESPNDFITLEILKSIRNSNLFKSVQSSKSRGENDFILESNIEEFMQFYSEDLKNSYVNMVISFTLIDSKTNTIIESKTFNSRVDVKTPNAQGGVEALNIALSEIIFKNIEWLNGVCR
ncbi:ABC-type transport auxiliary lipoprotein family protein [Sulfurimonas xiamenensis]|uniref:ABC-type transport auxiliary lipoprotein component domain-containing protein n=1 Tax=Sulfurimonas xiamenensis TaxID=2590021 RepID=A0AAJ4DN03_9BACT|nr:ABC-type transport auxiliary lipoprotein family protein [Sulfurimonas xiamenensis]QFR43689.1 hypothetical protein FJR47_07090 [Sulfurimonas xiamenensis]